MSLFMKSLSDILLFDCTEYVVQKNGILLCGTYTDSFYGATGNQRGNSCFFSGGKFIMT